MWPILKLRRKLSVVNMTHDNNSFSSYLTNGKDKLEYYITLGQKGFTDTNILAYSAH